jgi:hypothetical protein
MNSFTHLKAAAVSAALGLGLFTAARADDHGPRVPLLPKYQQECASCHMAFPPGMLPATSWKRLMGSLDKHFGSDASLDDASAREIGAWLQTHAGTYKRVSEAPPQDRITRSAWFLRKHRADEVAPEIWKRAAVGSPANCAACHPRAEQGRFSEHEIRIPR